MITSATGAIKLLLINRRIFADVIAVQFSSLAYDLTRLLT